MDRPRTRAGRAGRTALLAIAAAATCAGLAAPAQAATGTHTVTVLPDSSALELSTFPGHTDLRIEVLRAGVEMAKASVTTDAAGDADVNGGGADCWSDATPDILPGDVVQVSGPGFVDTKVVDDIAASRPVQEWPGTVVVHGHAKAADGTPLPVTSIEARVIGTSKDRFSNGRRDLRAGTGLEFPLTADAADPGAWTATFSGLTADDVTKVLASIEMRGIFTDTEDPSQTIAQSPAARGPAPPCSAPLRRDAITRANHAAVNATNVARDLVLSGVTQDAGAVSVTLDDDDATTAPVTVPATLSTSSGAQSFTATIPAADVQGLRDGTLTAAATYTVKGTDISGEGLTLLKDTVAPPAPTATPGPRTYLSAQSVTLADDDASATIHWTAGSATPTASSPAFTTPILITASQTIRAVAVDRAGNASPVAAFSFEIAVPVLPSAGSVTVTPQTSAPPAAAPPAAAPPAAVLPAGAVAGTQASALRVGRVALAGRVRATKLRRDGLRLSLHVPAEAAVIRVTISSADASGRAVGRPRATFVRLAPGRAGTMRLRLRSSALRRLHPGRYVVTVAFGRTRTALGPATRHALHVTR